MKPGWVVKKLGDVCELKPQKSEARGRLDADDMVSFAPMEDLGINQKYLCATQSRPLGEVVGSYTYFAEGDVLLAKITPCFENGKLGIAKDLCNGVGFGSSEYMVFRSPEALNNEFLYYYLSRQRFRDEGAQNMSGAVGHKRVAKEFIENYPIPLPPLAEQQRLVALLDEAFAGIDAAKANAERNLNNARALFDGYLAQVFSQRGEDWVEKRLGDIAEVQSGGTPLVSNKDYWNGDIAWYSSGELNQAYTFASERTISIAGLNNSNAKLFPKGSLLIGMYDTAALKMSVLDRDATFNQAIAGVKANEKVSMLFVLHAINAIKPQILSQRRGVRQKNLSLTKIKEIPIGLPNMTVQQAIVGKLDALSAETKKLEALYRQKIAALDELKQSLLHQAFTGEL